ncbi:MAG TPA: DUF3817 domain-containing protein [Chitinophagaceae bacterium]|nr:DUF3817 domain-containing protein [Chitinophagaceae bacterium]
MKTKKPFALFRKIAFAEGVSFLVLLFIAMPLKYFAAMPMAVTIIGSLHGILFIAMLVTAYDTRDRYGKNIGWLAKVFIASIIPFGTFIMDKEWKKEEAALPVTES